MWRVRPIGAVAFLCAACGGSNATAGQATRAQPSTRWPFTPEGSVTRQSSQDHVPSQGTVLRISWTGAKRQSITITNASQVRRVAHTLGELPKESQGACAERFISGPPTIEFAFRTPAGRGVATASQAAFQNWGIAWCVPTQLSVQDHAPVRLEGGSYFFAQAEAVLRRDLSLPKRDFRLPSY